MARPRTKRNYTGREKIIFTSVSHRDAPLSVELAGVTYPSPYYRIRHNPASSYVFEYVLEGRGWIEYERERLTVQEGDFILSSNRLPVHMVPIITHRIKRFGSMPRASWWAICWQDTAWSPR